MGYPTAPPPPTELEKAAQQIAVEVLMARLTKANADQRDRLRQRIAAIRGNALNSAPEVQAALLALERAPAILAKLAEQ